VAEAEAFGEGLAAGWRLAGRGGAAAESSEAAPTAAVAVIQALRWRQRRRQRRILRCWKNHAYAVMWQLADLQGELDGVLSIST